MCLYILSSQNYIQKDSLSEIDFNISSIDNSHLYNFVSFTYYLGEWLCVYNKRNEGYDTSPNRQLS